MITIYRDLVRKTYTFGRILILTIEIVAISIVIVMIGFTAYYVVCDLLDLALEGGGVDKIQLLVSDVFLLIILAEIVRSFLEAYRRPEMYIVGVTEVGLVVAIREIVLCAITGSLYDMLLASLAALVLAGALWILVTHVVRSSHYSALGEGIREKDKEEEKLPQCS